mgnify:CR=1 FL=1
MTTFLCDVSFLKLVDMLHCQVDIELKKQIDIDNIDDDMHNKKGIFQGHYQHVYGIRSLIVLEENNKNFYTFPENIKKL